MNINNRNFGYSSLEGVSKILEPAHLLRMRRARMGIKGISTLSNTRGWVGMGGAVFTSPEYNV